MKMREEEEEEEEESSDLDSGFRAATVEKIVRVRGSVIAILEELFHFAGRGERGRRDMQMEQKKER